MRKLVISLCLCASLAIAQQDRPTGLIAAYASNRDQGIGNFVTQDMLLLGHVLCLEEAATQAEQEIYSKEIQAIVAGLTEQASKAAASPITDANRQFLGVLTALITGNAPDSALAKEEVAKVLAATGISKSAILPETIDYSQFRIRGHYTRSPELGRYFQTVRYAGTVLFAVKESASTAIEAKDADQLTAQALQLSAWLDASPKTSDAYKQYIRQTQLLFGAPDDLVLTDLLAVRNLKAIAQQRKALLEAAKTNNRQPIIIGGIIDIGKLEPAVTAQDALTGWRLFPQYRSPDGAAFQQLLFPNTADYLGKQTPHSMDLINGKKVKAFPLALELPALLGSASATQALDATDERNYQGYAAAFAKARKALSSAPAPGSWLPVFQQLVAGDKPTTTALAYWTRNRHRSLLYEKQTYTPMLKSIAMAPTRTSAYLEPAAAVYKALLAQTQAIAPALKPQTAAALQSLLSKCIAISAKESSGKPLDSADITFLNDIDHQIMSIAGREDSPVVVDVHTNPSSNQVLEEAVGLPTLEDFKLNNATLRGARLTHFEFRQPIDHRMTDEEWQIRALNPNAE